METALQQARSVYESALDLPFKAAVAKDKFKRAIQPNIPYPGLEPSPMSRNVSRVNALPYDLGPQRTAGESAQMRPYILPPKSDLTKEQIKERMEPYNLRPGALDYYSNIPVKIGSAYLAESGGRTMGTAYKNPRYIGMRPNTSSNVLLHEYLHQTPRVLNPRNRFLQVFMKMFYPELTQAEPEFRKRWGEAYMDRPGAMQEEQFAEGLYPSPYYRHVFTPIDEARGYTLSPLNATVKKSVRTRKKKEGGGN